MNQTITYKNSNNIVNLIHQRRAIRQELNSGVAESATYKIASHIPKAQLLFGLIGIVAFFTGQVDIGATIFIGLYTIGLFADILGIVFSVSMMKRFPEDYGIPLKLNILVVILKVLLPLLPVIINQLRWV